MTTKFYTCTLLPEVTRDDPPKLGVRCNETGVCAAFWREEDRALFLAAPDLLQALETIALHAPSLDAAGIREYCDAAIAKATEKAV